ncbi:MAG TPA: lysophospholipid acyltransferase family protein [Thermomicrobiales bacterium]|nr:lysophospholipid acyltransferase family protein [Thermomicrobiales bacterium]
MPSRNGKATFQREKRHEFRYLLAIRIADFLSWIIWLVPKPVRYWFADRVADTFRSMTHTYRDNVEANVAQVVGQPVESETVQRATAHIFRLSSRNFVDLMTIPRASRRKLIATLTVTGGGWAMVDDAVAQGRGVIMVAAHLGAFDSVGQILRARGYKLTIVTGRTTSRFIFDGVTHLRGSRGVNLVEPTPSGVRKAIKALQNKECTVFVCDRDFFQNGREVEFFGRMTTLPPGPVRIARETGAIVLPLITSRDDSGYQVEILPWFTIEKTSDQEDDMRSGMRRLVELMEYGIRTRVDQWVMFQRVWPDKPVPAIRVFPIGSPLESELLEKVAQVLPERRRPEH